MPSYDTPVPNPGDLVVSDVYFARDNGPSTPGDFASFKTTEDGGLSSAALLDFIADVTNNTVWTFQSGKKVYALREDILP